MQSSTSPATSTTCAPSLLEFTGRRSGRRYRVPAGWHDAEGVRVVISPASWRANFANGTPVVVHHRGHAQHMTGTLVSDPAQVAKDIRAVLAGGTPANQIALNIPEGHTLTNSDVSSLLTGPSSGSAPTKPTDPAWEHSDAGHQERLLSVARSAETGVRPEGLAAFMPPTQRVEREDARGVTVVPQDV